LLGLSFHHEEEEDEEKEVEEEKEEGTFNRAQNLVL
jgi:hypothetical protein